MFRWPLPKKRDCIRKQPHTVTCGGADYSHSLKVLGAKILAGDMKPAFMVDLQLKDLRLVMETAQKVGQLLPGTKLSTELLQKLADQGRGRDGTQAFIDIIRRMANKK